MGVPFEPDPDYERQLVADPSRLRAALVAHSIGPGGRCGTCDRQWPCPAWESVLAAYQLVLAPRPAPGVPPALQAKVPPPTNGRAQLERHKVNGRWQWVVIADASDHRIDGPPDR